MNNFSSNNNNSNSNNSRATASQREMAVTAVTRAQPLSLAMGACHPCSSSTLKKVLQGRRYLAHPLHALKRLACTFAKSTAYSKAPYPQVLFPQKCFPDSQTAQDYCIIHILQQHRRAQYKYWKVFCHLHLPPLLSHSADLHYPAQFALQSRARTVEGFPDGVTQSNSQQSVVFTPFLWLFFLIPLTSILPFHHHYRSNLSNPSTSCISSQCPTLLLEAIYQAQLNSSYTEFYFLNMKNKKQTEMGISIPACS